MSLVLLKEEPTDVPTPDATRKTLFIRDDTGVPALKDSDGNVTDLVIPGDASGVTYTPADALNWTDSVDPGNVDDALNDLAARIVAVESDSGGAGDASELTYTPTTVADWDGDADPGGAQEALDQLAERITDIEESPGSGSSFGTIAVAGQSNVVADSSSDTLTLVGLGLAAITTDAGTDTVTITVAVPDASAVPFTPSNSMNWTDSEDPGDVDDALNDLAARLQGIEETESVFRNIAVSGQGTIVADGSNDTLTLAAGSNITLTTNTETDTVTITASGGGGGTIGKHMLPVMAASMAPRSANGCATIACANGASNQPDVYTLGFDATSIEYAEFAIAMPESWDEGTITFKPIWKHPATVTNFGVVWGLQAVAFSDDDALAANFGTAQTSTDTGGTTLDHYVGPESSAITIAGTPAAGDTVFFRVFRDPTAGSDTMAVDADLIGIRLYYTTAAETD